MRERTGSQIETHSVVQEEGINEWSPDLNHKRTMLSISKLCDLTRPACYSVPIKFQLHAPRSIGKKFFIFIFVYDLQKAR